MLKGITRYGPPLDNVVTQGEKNFELFPPVVTFSVVFEMTNRFHVHEEGLVAIFLRPTVQ